MKALRLSILVYLTATLAFAGWAGFSPDSTLPSPSIPSGGTWSHDNQKWSKIYGFQDKLSDAGVRLWWGSSLSSAHMQFEIHSNFGLEWLADDLNTNDSEIISWANESSDTFDWLQAYVWGQEAGEGTSMDVWTYVTQ